jgi:hypothetical protein
MGEESLTGASGNVGETVKTRTLGKANLPGVAHEMMFALN